MQFLGEYYDMSNTAAVGTRLLRWPVADMQFSMQSSMHYMLLGDMYSCQSYCDVPLYCMHVLHVPLYCIAEILQCKDVLSA